MPVGVVSLHHWTFAKRYRMHSTPLSAMMTPPQLEWQQLFPITGYRIILFSELGFLMSPERGHICSISHVEPWAALCTDGSRAIFFPPLGSNGNGEELLPLMLGGHMSAAYYMWSTGKQFSITSPAYRSCQVGREMSLKPRGFPYHLVWNHLIGKTGMIGEGILTDSDDISSQPS